jgi:hypothetical protein
MTHAFRNIYPYNLTHNKVFCRWKSILILILFCTEYYQDDQIKEDKVGGTCSTHGGDGYKILFSKPEGKRPLGTPRSRWEDNIKLDLKETVWD